MDPRPAKPGTDLHRVSEALRNRQAKKITGNHFTLASVLVPIQVRNDGDYLILTQRAEDLNVHSGQVAFPGGRIESLDRNPLEAALRESREEIGLEPRHVRILGELDQVTAAANYLVAPFVGLIPFPYTFRLNHHETAEVFSVPVATLLQPGNLITDSRLSSRGEPIYHFRYKHWDIWGATARIIKQLLEIAYDFKA